jgi:Lrp/AsnC family leucine-responsive transcriptional regulator
VFFYLLTADFPFLIVYNEFIQRIKGGAMDAIDRKIVDIMYHNGRISMKELAGELNLSAPAVAERVKRLEQAGIITGYRATVDRKKLGQNITVFINLDMPASKYDDFRDFAEDAAELSEFYYVTGQYSWS